MNTNSYTVALESKLVLFINIFISQNNVQVSYGRSSQIFGWLSSKSLGFTGREKGTKVAIEEVGYFLGLKLKEKNLNQRRFFYIIVFHGRGSLRHLLIRNMLKVIRLLVLKVIIKNRVAHNGCYIRKRKHTNWRLRKKRKKSFVRKTVIGPRHLRRRWSRV